MKTGKPQRRLPWRPVAAPTRMAPYHTDQRNQAKKRPAPERGGAPCRVDRAPPGAVARSVPRVADFSARARSVTGCADRGPRRSRSRTSDVPLGGTESGFRSDRCIGSHGLPRRAASDGSAREENLPGVHFFLAIASKCTISNYKKFPVPRTTRGVAIGRKGGENCTLWADICWSNSTVVTQTR